MPIFKLQITISPSMMHFLIFLSIAVAVTIFLVSKVQSAVNEIDKISNTEYVEARREAGITAPKPTSVPTPHR